jgi:HEAT repeat protein/DNA-binding transcriptional ArsR family regulator
MSPIVKPAGEFYTQANMSNFFRSIDLDQISFWIGFLGGILFFWLFLRLLPLLKSGLTSIRSRATNLKSGLTTSTEERFRGDILRYVQNKHLANMLCALDEILIPPKVILPHPAINPQQDQPIWETVEEIIPFLPEQGEFNAHIHTTAFTISEVMSKGASVLLLSNPGSGKSVALCSFASSLARRDITLGNLSNHLPVYLDARIVLAALSTSPVSSYDVLYSSVSRYSSTLTLPRLSEILHIHLNRGSAILILDSLDELTPQAVRECSAWLRSLLGQFPKIQVIAASSPMNHADLLPLGLNPAGLIGWNELDKSNFLEKWMNVWNELVLSQPINPYSSIPNQILRQWITNNNKNETPLEFTLRVWAAFAGDSLGPEPWHITESFFRRITQDLPQARLILTRLASNLIVNKKPIIQKNDLFLAISKTVPQFSDVAEENKPASHGDENKSKVSPSQQLINRFINQNILIDLGNDQYTISHLWLTAYLASIYVEDGADIENVLIQEMWEGRQLFIKNFSARQDLSPHFEKLMLLADEPLKTNLINTGVCLKFADPATQFVKQLLQLHAVSVQDKKLTLSQRLRLMVNLAEAKDLSTSLLFRKMLEQSDSTTRFIGCLGCGMIKDQKSIPTLQTLIQDPDPGVRKAALLGLGMVGDLAAMEAITYALIHGDESSQKCAAEVLATDPSEGFDTLQEGTTFNNLLVRRAVVSGLKKINQPWAIELLHKMHMEDDQWLVKNAAEHALRDLSSVHPAIPEKLPELINTPWLIEFASQQGIGIPTPEAALETLKYASIRGDEYQKIMAFQRFPNIKPLSEENIDILFNTYAKENDLLQDVAYQSLWLIAGQGFPPA